MFHTNNGKTKANITRLIKVILRSGKIAYILVKVTAKPISVYDSEEKVYTFITVPNKCHKFEI